MCVGLANKIHAYHGDAKFKTWLHPITVNACLDGHRQRNRQHAQVPDYLEYAVHTHAVNQDNAQQVAWLYQELARLKEPYKETAFLVLAEDLSHAEVGKVLSCAESTISWRTHEIRHQLKALMERRP